MRNLVIVGLGLIGGSAAMASEGFVMDGAPVHRIGVDLDASVLDAALAAGAIDEACPSGEAGTALRRAGLVVLCLYPEAALAFLREHAACISPGTVVTDMCGIKGGFVEQSAQLIPGSSYIGGHPMAGRELSGFSAALPTLFRGCNYIITPSAAAGDSAVELVRAFARHLGAGKLVEADPHTHDRNIAYTSQLAHALAAAVVRNPILLESDGFEGGSLADITRVAKMNSEMWSELFIENRTHLSNAILQLEEALALLRGMIERGERDALREELAQSSMCKERWARLSHRE